MPAPEKKNAPLTKPCMECKAPVELDKPTGLDVICRKCSAPDWSSSCDVCGASPVVPQTGMCGPCTWGDAESANGNW